MGGRIILEGNYSNTAGAAMCRNQMPMIGRMVLKNIGEAQMENLRVQISAEPAFLEPWSAEIPSLEAGESAELTPALELNRDFLFALQHQQTGSLHIAITSQEETEPLLSRQRPVMLLAAWEWEGPQAVPELAAAYVCSGQPCVQDLLRAAGRILEKHGQDPFFYGYQDPRSGSVRAQAAAIYEAVQNQGIFCVPAENMGAIGLSVTSPEEMLRRRQGTQLDFCLLFCACLEAAGLHPLLCFAGDQIYTGYWQNAEEEWDYRGQKDVAVLRQAVLENRLVVLDATGTAGNVGLPFQEALLPESELPWNDFCLFLDISAARSVPVQPLTEDTCRGNPAVLPLLQAEEGPVTRQQLWERRLLDLSLRNMLVNFRMTRSTLQLLAPNCELLEDAFCQGAEFQILPRPVEGQGISEKEIVHRESLPENLCATARTELDFGRLFSFLPEGELPGVLTAIYRQARTSLEENGSNTLYLALGFLRWYESGSDRARYAPLILLPAEIVRKSSRNRYAVRMRDEDPQINITLLEMLRQDFGMEVERLAGLPRGTKGIDLQAVFQSFRLIVRDQPRWDVEETAFLGLFSFSQFIMWSDLRNRSEDLKRNKVVRSLISGKMEWEPTGKFPKPEELDELCKPSEMAVPITADASQLAAICAAGMGKSFVLHGPPGTGKSQTITNMIANALYHGKSVLFIAEKMAALSVVQNRLEKIGLGPFSLELHSNKAKKRDVLSQLQKTLELGRLRSPQEYSQQAERLSRLRRELNRFVTALHRPQPFGLSAWEALSRLENSLDAPADVCFLREEVEKLTPRQMQLWEDIAQELQAAAESCGSPAGHPLREWNLASYSSSVRSELCSRIPALEEALERVRKYLKKFCGELGLPEDGSREYLEDLFRLAEFCRSDSGIPASLVSNGDLQPLHEELDELCAGGRRRDAAREALCIVYRQGILLYNEPTARKEWEEASADWILPRILRQGKVLKSLRSLAKDPKALLKEQIPAHLNLMAEYDAGTRIVAGKEHLFAPRFAHLWKNREPDWRELETKFEAGCRLQELAGCLVAEPEGRKQLLDTISRVCLSNFPGWYKRMGETLEDLLQAKEILEQERSRIWKLAQVYWTPSPNNTLEELAQTAHRWSQGLSELRGWCSWVAVQRHACEEGLSTLVSAVYSGAIAPEEIMPAYHRGLYSACADMAVERENALSSFQGDLFENKMRRFRDISEEFEQLTRQELAARLSAKIPVHSSGISASSEIGILQRAIRSGGRNMSIRRLFDSIPNLLRLLCPCMLMSPISVAQYIDPQYPPFDLVIFDEASQMPTCEAVGAIARGENVVVVGDPKQLPPTRFFMDSKTGADDPEQEDLESILDDCLAISMPEEHLRWHYRSRHESLIAFSNQKFYENKLYTFPSPMERDSRVTFVPIAGSYDRGSTKQNRAESEAVVAEILRRLSDPELCKKSIGVVTFSAAQQNLIEDLLMEAFSNHPEWEDLSQAEPIFVKNLENVQGDERDVILFSIGYGPDRFGRVAMNFGPLNREGGWRRLNVAVSRAREEMRVYSSLKPEQLDLSRSRSQGVAALRSFLEFAQKGTAALEKETENALPENGFAELLAGHIRRMGYEVRTHVGCSQFRIDLAVADPKDSSRYLLGILCDGENYLAGKTARDRNVNQEAVLRSLGWNLCRVWILEWRENPIGVLERLRETLRQAENGGLPLNLQTKTAPFQPEPEKELEPEEKLPEYTVCVLDPVEAAPEDFYLELYDQAICQQLHRVLETEAPISREQLCRRVLAAWGITRLGARPERRIRMLLEQLPVLCTQSGNREFYWNPGQLPEEYHQFRIPQEGGARRDPEDIPPEETACAVEYVLKRQVSLPKEDLIREVYRLFGFQRTGSALAEAADAGIQLAVERKIAAEEGGRFIFRQE